MGNSNTSSPVLQQPSAAATSTRPPSWRSVNHSSRSTQLQSSLKQAEHHATSSSGWSAIQQDFEQRLSRFGIKISDANDDQTSSSFRPSMTGIQSAELRPFVPSVAGSPATLDHHHHQAIARNFADPQASENFLPLEASNVARFTDSKKEAELEATERQLRQAHAEAQVWKEKSETRDRDLRTAYRETMEWRMKYEDLYSAVMQDMDLKSQKLQEERGHTKSLG